MISKKIVLNTLLSSLVVSTFTACGDTYKDSLADSGVATIANFSAGATLFEKNGCTGCHGVDGGTSALGVSRIIADISTQRDIQNALYTLRAETAGYNPVMVEQAKNLTDQEILDLATYVFSLRH